MLKEVLEKTKIVNLDSQIFGQTVISKRVLKNAHLELNQQNSSHCIINSTHGNELIFHQHG